MKTISLGRNPAPNVVLGLMRIQDKTDDEVRELIVAARDAGIDFFDHADVYGSDLHGCERRFAEAMRLTPAQREASGKVRAFGVSNHTPRQIDLLRSAVSQPIVANQLQLSITHAPIVVQGLAGNMQGVDQSVVLDGGGIVDYCRLHDITVQAWSPFQSGFFTGVFLESPEYPELNAVINRLAASYDVPAIAIATAWITRHPANMQVVLGTTSPERVTGAALGSDIPLTRAEWYELARAAGHRVP